MTNRNGTNDPTFQRSTIELVTRLTAVDRSNNHKKKTAAHKHKIDKTRSKNEKCPITPDNAKKVQGERGAAGFYGDVARSSGAARATS
jgi:hypothetical protein